MYNNMLKVMYFVIEYYVVQIVVGKVHLHVVIDIAASHDNRTFQSEDLQLYTQTTVFEGDPQIKSFCCHEDLLSNIHCSITFIAHYMLGIKVMSCQRNSSYMNSQLGR